MLVEVGLKQDSNPCRALVAKYLAEEKDDPFLGGVERRIAEPGASSADAEAEAARRALADAGENAANVDAIFSWALVPDRLMPSNACRVAHALGPTRPWALTPHPPSARPVSPLPLPPPPTH